MQHFGCDSWGCVEANFNEGGSLEDAWGWLNVLQAAHDGDTVSSTMLTQIGDKRVPRTRPYWAPFSAMRMAALASMSPH